MSPLPAEFGMAARGGRSDAASSRPGAIGRETRIALGFAALLLLVFVLAVGIGPVALAPAEVVRHLLAGPARAGALADPNAVIVWQIRLPRAIAGALVGAALAVSGAMMQGLFRNPLADPGLVGVSAGASFAAVSAIVLSGGVLAPLAGLLGAFTLPVSAFAGGLGATLLIYRIGTRAGRSSIALILLAGIALAAFAGAGTGFLVYLSDDNQLRDLTFWSLGGLGGVSWAKLLAALPMMALALLAAPLTARGLNAITLGEAEAFHMGVRVQALKRWTILLVALATGAAVALAGAIGFVGLVVPHLLRLLLGADHRRLLPLSALAGASLLLLADMAARVLVAPSELPIGILTAALGAPVFLWLLLRQRALAGFLP